MKNKLLIKIFVILIVVSLSSVILYFYVKNKKIKIVKTDEPNFIEKCSYETVDENWIYFFCLSYLNNDSKINYYDFGGYDLLNKDLTDEYGIPVKDGKTGEIINYMDVNIHGLIHGKKTREDVKKILDFFNDKNFKNEKLEEEIENLKLRYIDKNIVIKLYKKSLNVEPIEFGRYSENPIAANFVQETSNGILELGYLLYYGNIKFLKIDFIYKDGTHLSDIVNKNKATSKQENDYNKILSLEKKIISTQQFDLENDFEFNEFDINELKKLFRNFKQS